MNFYCVGESFDGQEISYEWEDYFLIESVRAEAIALLLAYEGGHLDIYDSEDNFVMDVEV